MLKVRFMWMVFPVVFTVHAVNAQVNKTDSLLARLKVQADDTSAFYTLRLLVRAYERNDASLALTYAYRHAELAKKLCHTANKQNENRGRKELRDAHHDLARIYYDKGSYDSALFFNLEGLKLAEQENDLKETGLFQNNMGNVYKRMGDLNRSLLCYNKALAVLEPTHDKRAIAVTLTNIGIICRRKGDNEKALGYYERSLKLLEEIGDRPGCAICLNNMGSIYLALKKVDKALEFQKKSLSIKEESGDKSGIAIGLLNIAGTYMKMKKHGDAQINLDKALTLALQADAKDVVKEVYSQQAQLSAEAGDYKTAYERHIEYSKIKDSLISERNLGLINEMQAKYETEKKDKELFRKNAELKESVFREEKEKAWRYSLYGGLALTIAFGAIMFNRFAVTRRQKTIIERQKQKVDEAYEMLAEKNKEVMDSIYYARRIQRALVTSERYIHKHLHRLRNN